MVEVLKSFEWMAGRLHPVVLVVPGLVMVGLGLFAWLAGLHLRRIVLALIGAAAGLLGVFFAGLQDPRVSVPVVAGGAVCGALLPRLTVAVFLAALGAVVPFGFIAGGHSAADRGRAVSPESMGVAAERLSVRESLEVVRVYGVELADRAVAETRRFLPMHWAILASVGSGLLMLSVLFGRLAEAMTCSAVGAVLISVGLVVLLMFKGSAPVTHMEPRAVSCGLVLLGMAVFGTVEQLCLCRPARPEMPPKGRKTPAKRKKGAAGRRRQRG